MKTRLLLQLGAVAVIALSSGVLAQTPPPAGATSRSAGSVWQISCANQQRVRKRHPVGGLTGLGPT